MNLVSTYRRNWKRTNVQLVSLACGLALATVAIVGANEVLRYKDSVVIISPAALQPQFGTAADAAYAAQSLGTQAAVSPGDALGIGQPGEGTQSVAAPQFGTAADAVYAMEGEIQLP